MVFFLLAEVSFSFISYVGIATLCCLRYWGATPQRGPSPDCLSAAPTAQTTNRQPPRWTMDRFRSPRPWTRPGIGMPHAIPFPFSAPSCFFDRANEPPTALRVAADGCERRLGNCLHARRRPGSKRGQHYVQPTSTRSRAPLATSRQPDRRLRTTRVALTHSRSLSAN